MLAYHQHGEPPEYEGTSETLFQLYRLRTAQCLQSGDISKCLPYTVETLRLNATAELNRKDDIRRGLWIMTGVVVRTAINMGYHRDPSHTPGLSPLQAEYRRRIWLSVISMDDMASFVGGFPRTTQAIFSDTEEPRNLHDGELSEETAVLPPSRPLAEPTPVTYLLLKGRLFRALGRVGDLATSPTPPSYDAVLEADEALRDAYESFPPHMRLDHHPVAGADKTNPHHPGANTNFANAGLLVMYHRGMCTLHRRFLARSRADGGRYELSRERCVSSALAMLGFQRGLGEGWYEVAQARQVLMLAGMVVVLELELRRRASDEGVGGEVLPRDEVLVAALEGSREDWGAVAGGYEEAVRFRGFLGGVLEGIRRGKGDEVGDGEGHRIGHSQRLAPEMPGWDGRGAVLPFEMPGGGVSFEQDLSEMDIDWVCHPLLRTASILTDDPRLHGMRLSRTPRLALAVVRYTDGTVRR